MLQGLGFKHFPATQTRLSLQFLPLQGLPSVPGTPPGAAQVPLVRQVTSDSVHCCPVVQQGLPGVPQVAVQRLLTQVKPLLQREAASQHVCPLLPQATQLLPSQTLPEVHSLLLQQVWLALPQLLGFFSQTLLSQRKPAQQSPAY
jgi:hypothetical protein